MYNNIVIVPVHNYLHTLIKNLSSSCMIIVAYQRYSELNFEDPLRRFCKKRVRDRNYDLSKLEILCALLFGLVSQAHA